MGELTCVSEGVPEADGPRVMGSLSQMWGLLKRIDLGESLSRDEMRALRRMARRWRSLLRRLGNKPALATFEKRLRRSGI